MWSGHCFISLKYIFLPNWIYYFVWEILQRVNINRKMNRNKINLDFISILGLSNSSGLGWTQKTSSSHIYLYRHKFGGINIYLIFTIVSFKLTCTINRIFRWRLDLTENIFIWWMLAGIDLSLTWIFQS